MAEYTELQKDHLTNVGRMLHKRLIDIDEAEKMAAAIEDDPAYLDGFDGEYCCGVPIDQ